MNLPNKTKSNPWKWAFLALLAFIIVPIIALYVYLQIASTNLPSTVDESSTTTSQSDETIVAEANLTTMSFNRLVDAVIGGNAVPYQLTVDKQVTFSGQIDFLGTQVPYTMEGLPSVTADGNILIDITSIQLADIDLPTETVLTLFQLTIPTDLPLQVLANKQQMLIRLDEISADMDFRIRAKEIDLTNDKIEIYLDVPISYLEEQIEANQATQ
ncbi:YpmS family protein [Aerococcus sp. 1KP-2016]|uniref:YpmS family protein n=1 Tax=Aerococcus sp. 1KP-2016 TaxID=1981982 RepID=UPI000BCC9B3C|nr:YpmS family protein [Aerococcus sp. 1KP-2016]OYQ67840.1 hypothetical protein B9P78_02405 [Aerococcus sp. 1KP-2016]